MRPAPLLLVLLLAGCGSSTRVRVVKPTTQSACAKRTVTAAAGGKLTRPVTTGVKVETLGSDTVLTWLGTGQTFTLKGLSGWWGTVAEDHADIWIGLVRVQLDAERLRVDAADAHVEVAIGPLRKGERRNLEIRVAPGSVSATPL